jgi:hypothetical protein
LSSVDGRETELAVLSLGYFVGGDSSPVDGDIAFRQHSGGHTTGPNWPTFLTLADRNIKSPALSATPPAADK